MKYTFQAGKYWIGDPCYAIKDENWDLVGAETGWFGSDSESKLAKYFDGTFVYNGRICFANSTAYGDGVYSDNKGFNDYGVDAGLIGILPYEVCDGDYLEGGNIVEFEKEFKVWEDKGKFYFDDLIIDTVMEEEDDNYWDEEEEYEEDEDDELEDGMKEDYL